MLPQKFSLVPGTYAVCRLPAESAVPPWASAPGGFISVTRTGDELSIVCEEGRVPSAQPETFRGESGYALLKIHGPFPLETIGILAGITKPLADAGISLLAIGTFDTDYVLVRRAQAARAVVALTQSGHSLVED
jgi:uncharacterized protein